MSARDDYPALASSVSGVLYISDALDITRREGQQALDEIDRLRTVCDAAFTAIRDDESDSWYSLVDALADAGYEPSA